MVIAKGCILWYDHVAARLAFGSGWQTICHSVDTLNQHKVHNRISELRRQFTTHLCGLLGLIYMRIQSI